MSKQDRQGVRKAADIEQKYGLGQFMYNQKKANAETERNLTNMGESFDSYKKENDQNFSKLKEDADNQFKKINESIGSVAKDIDALSKAIFGMIYPVGSIYISVSEANPSAMFGGTWEQIKDRFLLAAGSSYKAGATGGEATHVLTINEMPKHNHIVTVGNAGSNYLKWAENARNSTKNAWGPTYVSEPTGNNYYARATGGDAAHNNMPPYLAVYVWKRTA